MTEQQDYNAPGYDVFKKQVKKLTGLDLNSYKHQIHRRVHMLMDRWKITAYEEYFRTIRESDLKLREFLDYLTINVSEFFRNPLKWTEVRERILPELTARSVRRQVKMWSAGCATGEEPYSLAILSLEEKLSSRQPVLASDIDSGALALAKKGHFLKRQLRNVPPDLLEKYFIPEEKEICRVSDEVKNRVAFQRLNLVEDAFDGGFDLILCRNVVIYFSSETKVMLYNKFLKALSPGGYLLVGSTEQIFDYKKIGFESAGAFIYRRPER